MHIISHGGLYIVVSDNLFQGIGVHTRFSGSCNEGVSEDVAREAFTLAAAKLPFPTRFVSRQVI